MKPRTAKYIDTAVGRISYYSAAPSQPRATAVLWPSLFTSGHATWELQLAPLHALGFRTIVVDPPGHGASGPPPRHFTIRQCSESVLRILDRENVECATFLGVSWGGFVALQTAIIAPERVSALILSNTSARRMPAMTRLRDHLLSRLVETGLMSGRFGLPQILGRAVVAGLLGAHARSKDLVFASALVREVNRLDRIALARAMKSVLVEREDLSGELQRIRAPTLVIAGECDEALPPSEHGALIAKAIPGARYVVLPKVGHLAPREAPSDFTGQLNAFLGANCSVSGNTDLDAPAQAHSPMPCR